MSIRPDDAKNNNAEDTPIAELQSLLSSEKVIAYYPVFEIIAGSTDAALWLSQAWYWSQTKTAIRRGGWFWKTREEWKEETGLTRRQQETVRRILLDRGFIYEERRASGRLWFLLDVEVIASAVGEVRPSESGSELPPVQINRHDSSLSIGTVAPLNRYSSDHSIGTKRADSYHENTPKITKQEKTAGEMPLASGRSLSLTPSISLSDREESKRKEESVSAEAIEQQITLEASEMMTYLLVKAISLADERDSLEQEQAALALLRAGNPLEECKGCFNFLIAEKDKTIAVKEAQLSAYREKMDTDEFKNPVVQRYFETVVPRVEQELEHCRKERASVKWTDVQAQISTWRYWHLRVGGSGSQASTA